MRSNSRSDLGSSPTGRLHSYGGSFPAIYVRDCPRYDVPYNDVGDLTDDSTGYRQGNPPSEGVEFGEAGLVN